MFSIPLRAVYYNPKTLRFTVIRKYLQQIITNIDKQDCKQKQRVNHFQKWLALCFSTSALLRSRTPFLREKVKSLPLDVFVSVSRLNQGFFALYCVTLLWQFT